MPLTGTYQRTLDDKRRLAVPKRLRDDFGEVDLDSLYVAPGTDRCLVLYSPGAFANLGSRLAGGAGHQSYLRLFYSSAERVDVDGQGRIRVPDRLAEFAGLKKDAYLLGVQDHAELWDKDTWDEISRKLAPEFDRLALDAWKA